MAPSSRITRRHRLRTKVRGKKTGIRPSPGVPPEILLKGATDRRRKLEKLIELGL